MNAVDASTPAPAQVRHALYLAAPAIVSVATYIVLDLVLAARAGQPGDFWSVDGYRLTMNLAVLLRMGPLFFSGLVVWPAMRARGAPWWGCALGILATPLAFAAVSGIRAAAFFPPLEAAYYATNPVVVGAIGAQVATAGIGALVWRWHAAGWRSPPPGWWSWGAVIAIVTGLLTTFVAVQWDGGQHLFYPWILVYRALFAG